MKNTNLPFYVVLIGAIALIGFVVFQGPNSTSADPAASDNSLPAGNYHSRDGGNPDSSVRSSLSAVSSDGRVGSAHADDSPWIDGWSEQSEESDAAAICHSREDGNPVLADSSVASSASSDAANSSNSILNSSSAGSSGGGSSSSDASSPNLVPAQAGIRTPDSSGGSLAGQTRTDCKVVVLSSCQRALQDEYTVVGQAAAEIFCAKNETESFQLLVCNPSGSMLPDVEITVSPFQPQGSAGRMPVMTLYREHYVKTTEPSWGLPAETPVGWYPNALIPFVDPYTNQSITSAKYLANHQSVSPKKSQGYWADVKVSADVPAGAYTCSIVVTSSGSPIAEIPVTLNVWDFTLPAKRAWTAWFSMLDNIGLIYDLPKNEGSDYDLLMSRHQDMLYEHGIYPTFQVWPGFNDKGKVNFKGNIYYQGGYKSYESILHDFIKKYGPGALWIPFAVIQNKFDKAGNNPVGAQILTDYHIFSLAHPEYGQFFYLIDEPYTVEIADQVINIAKLINERSLSSIKIFTNGDVYADFYRANHFLSYKAVADAVEAASDIRSFYCRTQMQPFTTPQSLEEMMQKTIDDGRLAWICQTSKLDNDLLMNRIGTWRGYIVGATGQLEWRTIPSDPALNPWIDPVNLKAPAPQRHKWNGYDQYVYPGTPSRVGLSGPGGPVASMMLKVFRDSVDDYAYFKLLESLTDQQSVIEQIEPSAPDFKTHKAAAEYASVRKTIAELILSKMN